MTIRKISDSHQKITGTVNCFVISSYGVTLYRSIFGRKGSAGTSGLNEYIHSRIYSCDNYQLTPYHQIKGFKSSDYKLWQHISGIKWVDMLKLTRQ